jgi:hypothetical protein
MDQHTGAKTGGCLMAVITIELTTRELELLTSLASDQLFRREFIDRRFPGFRADPADLSFGKDLVARLRETLRHAHTVKGGKAVLARMAVVLSTNRQ